MNKFLLFAILAKMARIPCDDNKRHANLMKLAGKS